MSGGPVAPGVHPGMSVLPGTRLGRYDVLSPLGAGAMGEVYRGFDTQLGRDVALKVLPETLAQDPEHLSRFEREARAVSALNHPNIVTIHEIGREGRTAFLAMELIDGETLRAVLDRGALAPRKALALAAQIADGLAQAHAAGIVHRDLKPENVMVTKAGRVKILDFGLARRTPLEAAGEDPTLSVPDDATRPGAVFGTVSYMSPEQASGRPVDFRSDQFSLGSILHEMLSGRRCWRRGSAAEALAAILRDEAPALDASRDVRRILDRCLAKDPDARYASTRDLVRDLEEASGSPAVSAAPGPARPEDAPTRGLGRRVLAGLALLAAVAAGWAIARATAPPVPPAPTYQRLTFRRGMIANARLTPDGRAAVYGAFWEGEPGPRLELTRFDAPGAQAFDFENADILSISRSSELALLLGSGWFGTLAVVPLVGGSPRPRVENAVYGSADWAPDGSGLAVVRRVDGRSRLEFPIGHVLVEEGALTPRFSTAGDRIAFVAVEDGGTSVCTIGASGGAKTVLSKGWADVAGSPAWSPDGREVWFTAIDHPGATPALRAVDASGRLRLLLRAPGGLELDDVGRDGRVLLQHFTSQRAVWSQSDGGPRREISWLDGSTVADVTADGATALLNEEGEGEGSPTMYVRRTDGSPPVRLGRGTGIALSPDGRWVLASPGGSAGPMLVPTGPGEGRTLPGAGIRDLNGGAFLPGAGGIVFSAAGPGGHSRVYVQMLGGGAPRPISPEGTWISANTSPVSPNGKFVVVSSRPPDPGSSDHSLFPVDASGPSLAIRGLVRGEVPIQWGEDSRSLYVVRRGENPARVWRLDLETGKRSLWREIAAPSHGGVFAIRITPDGRTCVYGGTLTLGTLYLASGIR